jgi:hypothetical protein
MARTIWKVRSYFSKLISRTGETGICPEDLFRETLVQERNRAIRAHRALVVMIIDVQNVCTPGAGEITEYVGERVISCIRQSDICGILPNRKQVGVILTEIEAQKINAAQLVVERKIREELASCVGAETVKRIGITFRTLAPVVGTTFDLKFDPDTLLQSAEQSP